MKQLVFLLEEPSMKELLDIILPKILPNDVMFLTIPHEGKSDLEKSIPRKLRAFRTPDTKFVVLRDQDSWDCHLVKDRLVTLCAEGGRPDTLVRVVCHELESWFLGDLLAVEAGCKITGISRLQEKVKYRNPDDIARPCEELMRLVPDYQKLSGARDIAEHLNIENNRSTSFRIFVSGVRRMTCAS
ncbi:MAG: DUF4276 family protein [Peptococcaceae bacterium]